MEGDRECKIELEHGIPQHYLYKGIDQFKSIGHVLSWQKTLLCAITDMVLIRSPLSTVLLFINHLLPAQYRQISKQ